MLDWPGRVAATVFVSGCNMRCPYCHNASLVGRARSGAIAVSDVIAHLRDRRDWLDGVVVTGGEPTIAPGLEELLRAVKNEGMPAKLDTNGTRPDVLAHLIEAELVDYVAMDVKSIPERTSLVASPIVNPADLARSIDIIIESGIDHEFRTTAYPAVVGLSDFDRIAARIAGARRYFIQQFQPRSTLDAGASSVRPYAASELEAAALRCRTSVPTTVRGI
jgi:pyruvate formate lyase activating enzyme